MHEYDVIIAMIKISKFFPKNAFRWFANFTKFENFGVQNLEYYAITFSMHKTETEWDSQNMAETAAWKYLSITNTIYFENS